MQQLNFEGEPFGEYAFNGEGEEEFERPRVRDHRTGGSPAQIGRPRVGGGPRPRAAAFRQGMAFGRGFSRGLRRGAGFGLGFGGGFRGFGGGRRFGFGPGFAARRRMAFRRRFGFGPGFGLGRRGRRFRFLRRFGAFAPGGFSSGFSGGGFSGGSSASSSSSFDGGAGASQVPSPWVQWAQSCLAQIVGDWVPQDGTMDPATRRAIQTFQAQQQLPPTGMLDEGTLSALQAACGGSDDGGGGDEGNEGV